MLGGISAHNCVGVGLVSTFGFRKKSLGLSPPSQVLVGTIQNDKIFV